SVDGEAAWAFVGPFPGNEWHKVILSCSHGDISCTVDERVVKVDYVNKAKLHKALFYLHVKANDTGAVRRFEVVAGVGKAEIPEGRGGTVRLSMSGKGHKGVISGIGVTRDGRVVTTSWDGSVRVWA